MEIINGKALQLVTRHYEQIHALIPKSKILEVRGDKAKVLVHWGDTEAQILRNLGVRGVPSPILKDYSWPGMHTPFSHQRDTAAFLATNPRCFCLSEAGTGKTNAAIWAADYLMEQGKVSKALIVCPVSIMDTAWRADLFRTTMHRSVGIATGSRHRRLGVISKSYDFTIINFDGVKVVSEALRSARYDLIIVDEANFIKNVSSDRWKRLVSIVHPNTRLWLMTGTPASQSPEDAYGLAKLVNPSAVPAYFNAFRDEVMVKVSQYAYKPRAGAMDTVYKVLQPAIRFTKEQCLDLPGITYTARDIALTKQQKHYYEEIRKRMVATAAGSEITALNAAGLLNKLLQVSMGAAYTTDGDTVEFDISHRYAELQSVIDGTAHKVIVFVPFRHTLDRLEQDLIRDGYTTGVLHGGVAAGTRADTVKAFQTQDSPRVLLAQPAAVAHGLTLTRADTVVWWGPVPSTELYLQGNARAYRAGQTNKVTVVRLQGSPVEKRMYDMLDKKIDLHTSLVDLYQQEIA